ncbi:MAG TPA: hypothetical protein VFS43_21265 [Polyangiaceae bacterium]|nr:hypothetical protein [Polyangiaceae bacterium]
MGVGVEAVSVLSLEADRSSDLAAKTLTNALRQTVLDEPEYTLDDENPSLILMARELKCPMGRSGGELPDERVLDDACLRKAGKFLGVSRFFWGYVTAGAGGAAVVWLHFWQRGQPDRVATLPYDAAARDRIAARLYRTLVTPEKVGDVALSGAAQGDLVVDGRGQGAYAPGVELTLSAGEHALKVRQGPRVVARANVRVESRGRAEARLEPVAEPAPSPARTLSAVSLGVGLVAGASLAAYLLAPRRGAAPIAGAVVPLAGGAVAGVAGSF